MAQDSDSAFLYVELLGFCFFQYYLNSTLSIFNSGQIFLTLPADYLERKMTESHFVCLSVKSRLDLIASE